MRDFMASEGWTPRLIRGASIFCPLYAVGGIFTLLVPAFERVHGPAMVLVFCSLGYAVSNAENAYAALVRIQVLSDKTTPEPDVESYRQFCRSAFFVLVGTSVADLVILAFGWSLTAAGVALLLLAGMALAKRLISRLVVGR